MLLVKAGANGDGAVGIDGAIPLFDVLDLAFLVDDDRGAFGPIILVAFDVVGPENAVGFQHLAVHIAQEGERHADLLGEGGVGSRAVNADSEDCRVTGFELGLISLIGLKFFRSTAGEGQNIKSEDDVLFSPVIA